MKGVIITLLVIFCCYQLGKMAPVHFDKPVPVLVEKKFTDMTDGTIYHYIKYRATDSSHSNATGMVQVDVFLYENTNVGEITTIPLSLYDLDRANHKMSFLDVLALMVVVLLIFYAIAECIIFSD